ncbi:MAG: gliding motility-associated C-terminal domain-containing protein, partial [Bacteroidota bacterium]
QQLNLIAGTYTVTISDGTGCSAVDMVDVTAPLDLTAAIAIANVSCNGDSDGELVVTANGGTPDYTYLWDDLSSQTTMNATGLVAGTYMVTVTDNNGCVETASAEVTEPDILGASATGVNISCFGGNDGEAQASVTGGTPDYTYLWDDLTGQTTDLATGLIAGTYTVTVTDNNACETTASVTLTEPANPVALAISGTDISCNAGNNGTATVVANGGTPGYTYLWSDANNQTTDLATGLTAGTYTVTVTDNNGCEETSDIILNEPSALNEDAITSTAVSCSGDSDGTAFVLISGGTPFYTYQWNDVNSQTTATATGLAEGNYTVQVTDANACVLIATVDVTGPPPLTVGVTGSDVLCNGGDSGFATATPAGGNGIYTFLWDDLTGQTTATATGLIMGTYVVTVTDQNACEITGSIDINEPTLLELDSSFTAVSCFGGNDGTATITPSGGTPNYTYAWDSNAGNQTNPTATGLTAGTFGITVVDNNGCVETATMTVTEPATPVTSTVSATLVSCFGGDDGTATVVPAGGTPDYTFQWDNNAADQTTDVATGLIAGNYIVTITDNNGCEATNIVTVNEPAELTISLNSTPESCFGADGTATVVPAGGTGDYTYLWDPSGQTDATATGLLEGTYTVSVTDVNSCLTTGQVDVGGPTPITIDVSSTPVSCFGGSDGTATATGNGGAGGFSYEWSAGGQIAPTATGLAAGTYTVTVTDMLGCDETASIDVTEPTALALTSSGSNVSCNGGADGSTAVFASGATPPYSYLWNDGNNQTTDVATGLTVGTYTVTVTDNNGCVDDISVILTEPTAQVITGVNIINVSCNGGSDASITIFNGGGTAPYTYLWDDPNAQTTGSATGLSAGDYALSITDANGCLLTDSYTVIEPAAITIAVSQTPSTCFEGTDGTASAVASGGTPAPDGSYQFNWSNGQQSATATGLTGGVTYIVTVTDNLGCTETADITIGQPAPIILTIVGTDVSCFGGDDGTAGTSVSGGTAPYTYVWDAATGNQTSDTAVALSPGVYDLQVFDANGCTTSGSVTIGQPTALDLTLRSTEVLCKGDSTGSVDATVAGGTPEYTLIWTNAAGDTLTSTQNLPAGIYQLVVTDRNECTIEGSVEVIEPAELLGASITPIDASCFGRSDGRIEVFGSGGTPPYEYSVDGINYNGSNLIIGLAADTYDVYVRDSRGCIYQEFTFVDEPQELLVDAGLDQTMEFGESLQLFATPNQDGDFSYSWTTFTPGRILSCRDCANPIARPDNTVDFQVTIQNANGCTATDDIRINVIKVDRVFIANAFTPNGDGNNDFFFVQGGEGIKEVYELRVFDRWGELVFKVNRTDINDPTMGWDGTFKGDPMNPGVFTYVAIVEFDDRSRQSYKGTVTLIR